MAGRIVDTTSAATDRMINNRKGASAAEEEANNVLAAKVPANRNAPRHSAQVRGPQMKLPGTGTNG
jgi:hypothetical protein